MRPRKPTLFGAFVGMLVGLLPVAGFMAFLYFGLTMMPYSDDPCLNDTRRANVQIGSAVQHYAASLVEARKAAAEWQAFAATAGVWRDNPGRTPQIAEY